MHSIANNAIETENVDNRQLKKKFRKNQTESQHIAYSTHMCAFSATKPIPPPPLFDDWIMQQPPNQLSWISIFSFEGRNDVFLARFQLLSTQNFEEFVQIVILPPQSVYLCVPFHIFDVKNSVG